MFGSAAATPTRSGGTSLIAVVVIGEVAIARPTPNATIPGTSSAYDWAGATSAIQSAPAAATAKPAVAMRPAPTRPIARPASGATTTNESATGVMAMPSPTGP